MKKIHTNFAITNRRREKVLIVALDQNQVLVDAKM